MSLAVSEPSLTVTVIVAEPFWFAAGVTNNDRFVPVVSGKVMLAFGTNVVFDDVAVTTRLFAVALGVTDA